MNYVVMTGKYRYRFYSSFQQTILLKECENYQPVISLSCFFVRNGGVLLAGQTKVKGKVKLQLEIQRHRIFTSVNGLIIEINNDRNYLQLSPEIHFRWQTSLVLINTTVKCSRVREFSTFLCCRSHIIFQYFLGPHSYEKQQH